MGYACDDLDAVREAVHHGVNVVVWFFAVFVSDASSSPYATTSPQMDRRRAQDVHDSRLVANMDACYPRTHT
jgi:hypothetical protein